MLTHLDHKVSIVTLVVNRLPYIRRCLDAVEKYTNVPYEHIIINDGICPAVHEYLMGLPKDKYRVYSDQKHKGICVRFNEGLKYSTGDVWCQLDSDMEVEPYWLERMVDALHWGHPGSEHKNMHHADDTYHLYPEIKAEYLPPTRPKDLKTVKAGWVAATTDTMSYPAQSHNLRENVWENKYSWMWEGMMAVGGCLVAWKRLLDDFAFDEVINHHSDVQVCAHINGMPEYCGVITTHAYIKHLGEGLGADPTKTEPGVYERLATGVEYVIEKPSKK